MAYFTRQKQFFQKTLKFSAPNLFFQKKPKFLYLIVDFFDKVYPVKKYLRQTTKQPEISRNLMEKIDFFRFSQNCSVRCLVMLKWFLGALLHSKQPPKILDTSWDHFKKVFSNRTFDLQKPFLLTWPLDPLKMAFYWTVQNLKAPSKC